MAHNCTNDLTENNKSKPSGSQTCNNGEPQKQQKIKRQQGHSTSEPFEELEIHQCPQKKQPYSR